MKTTIIIILTIKPRYYIFSEMACAPREDSDHAGHHTFTLGTVVAKSLKTPVNMQQRL